MSVIFSSLCVFFPSVGHTMAATHHTNHIKQTEHCADNRNVSLPHKKGQKKTDCHSHLSAFCHNSQLQNVGFDAAQHSGEGPPGEKKQIRGGSIEFDFLMKPSLIIDVTK